MIQIDYLLLKELILNKQIYIFMTFPHYYFKLKRHNNIYNSCQLNLTLLF